MRSGKLSKTDVNTLYRAYELLNRWCDYHEQHSTQQLTSDAYREAAIVCGELRSFIFEQGYNPDYMGD